jgi:hypothetical protein
MTNVSNVCLRIACLHTLIRSINLVRILRLVVCRIAFTTFGTSSSSMGLRTGCKGLDGEHERSETILTLKSSSSFLPFFLRFPLSPSRSTSSAIPRASRFSDSCFRVGNREAYHRYTSHPFLQDRFESCPQ